MKESQIRDKEDPDSFTVRALLKATHEGLNSNLKQVGGIFPFACSVNTRPVVPVFQVRKLIPYEQLPRVYIIQNENLELFPEEFERTNGKGLLFHCVLIQFIPCEPGK